MPIGRPKSRGLKVRENMNYWKKMAFVLALVGGLCAGAWAQDGGHRDGNRDRADDKSRGAEPQKQKGMQQQQDQNKQPQQRAWQQQQQDQNKQQQRAWQQQQDQNKQQQQRAWQQQQDQSVGTDVPKGDDDD